MSESGQFFFATEDTYYPMTGGINWREKLRIQYEKLKRKPPQPVWFQVGEFVMQLCQDNTVVYRCRVDPQFNCMGIQDPRDGEWWKFHKVNTPHYDECERMVLPWATEIRSELPQPSIIESVMDVLTRDVVSIEYVPEEWEK